MASNELQKLRDEYERLKYKEAISSLKKIRAQRQVKAIRTKAGGMNNGLKSLAFLGKNVAKSTGSLTKQSINTFGNAAKQARKNKKRTKSIWKKSIY